MDIFITLSADRRRQLCEVAGNALGLDVPSVEKDFWVCWVLRELFALPKSGPHLTFKGGTSLSKGWKLIEGFSEDIDAVIDREFLGFGGEQAPESAPSNKKRNERIEALTAACQTHIREVMSPELTQRFEKRLPAGLKWRVAGDPADDDGQTLLFEYPRTGRPVIPGLIDSHSHPIRGGLYYNLKLRWDSMPSLADAMRMLREQVQRTPPNQCDVSKTCSPNRRRSRAERTR